MDGTVLYLCRRIRCGISTPPALMNDADRVIDGVRVHRPGGRFVAEMGGYEHATLLTQLTALVRHGRRCRRAGTSDRATARV
jgi:hypothetical protein